MVAKPKLNLRSRISLESFAFLLLTVYAGSHNELLCPICWISCLEDYFHLLILLQLQPTMTIFKYDANYAVFFFQIILLCYNTNQRNKFSELSIPFHFMSNSLLTKQKRLFPLWHYTM